MDNINNSPIEKILIDLQCDLIAQTEGLREAIFSDDTTELTNVLYRWLELRDIAIKCDKIEKNFNQKSLKTKFWFEVNNEEQLKLFNTLFDKMYEVEEKDEVLEQFLIAGQCRLIEETERLQKAINSNDSMELTNDLHKWLELRDTILFGVEIKNILNRNSYRTKFGINVNSEEQLNLFNELFVKMSDSSEKDRVFELFLNEVQSKLVSESEKLQEVINSNDSMDLTNVLHKWLELRDTILFGIEIKNMLNKNSYMTKFGINVNSEEQLELFNNLFGEMIDYMKINSLFQGGRTR